MSIKPLIPPVEALVQEELARASEKFGERHHSPHEAYAVMLEEFEETQDEIAALEICMKAFWSKIKANENGNLAYIKSAAKRIACEAIQLAAMCEKAQRGYETEDKK